jgi:phenylacetate-coenzyme A ligase PaaK-like adenylate-forming protein
MNLFEKEALALFAYQFEHNPVYRSFCDLTNVSPSDVKSTLQIPFLPITRYIII